MLPEDHGIGELNLEAASEGALLITKVIMSLCSISGRSSYALCQVCVHMVVYVCV